MSAVARVAAPAPAPTPAARPAYLRLVPQRRSKARRAPFVAVVVGLLVAGLLTLLALNTVLAQDAFHLHELRVEGKQLADREQALLTEVEELQAPAAIVERATAEGMVPGGPPSFLHLPEGVVSGEGAPAPAVQPQLLGESAAESGAGAAAPDTPAGEQPAEQEANPRSASVRLRAAERLRDAA